MVPQQLQSRGECYLLAVPSNTSVRDLAAPDPPHPGPGRPPLPPFGRADRWAAAVPAWAWQAVEVRDAEKGPLVVQVARGLVHALTERRPSDVAELLVVFRERQGDGTWKYDDLLPNAPPDTSLAEFARVFEARNRVEECLKRAKGEAGLADSQVRTWQGWHHHKALSLVATWFLTRETRRGEKVVAGADGAAGGGLIAAPLNRMLRCLYPARVCRTVNRRLRRNEEARLYHWRRRNRLPPRRLDQRTSRTQ